MVQKIRSRQPELYFNNSLSAAQAAQQREVAGLRHQTAQACQIAEGRCVAVHPAENPFSGIQPMQIDSSNASVATRSSRKRRPAS